jgi:hypothetical protein
MDNESNDFIYATTATSASRNGSEERSLSTSGDWGLLLETVEQLSMAASHRPGDGLSTSGDQRPLRDTVGQASNLAPFRPEDGLSTPGIMGLSLSDNAHTSHLTNMPISAINVEVFESGLEDKKVEELSVRSSTSSLTLQYTSLVQD